MRFNALKTKPDSNVSDLIILHAAVNYKAGIQIKTKSIFILSNDL